MPYRSNNFERSARFFVFSRNHAKCFEVCPVGIEDTVDQKEDPGLDNGGGTENIQGREAKTDPDRDRPVLNQECARDKSDNRGRGQVKEVRSSERQDQRKEDKPPERPTGEPEIFHDCRTFHIKRTVSTRKGINRYPP